MTKQSILVNNLSKKYTTKGTFGAITETFWALKDVSFELLEGEILCILGESGSGKSTLAKILVGALSPTEGEVIIDNKNICELSDSRRLQHNRRIRMVFQDTLGSLNPSLTLGEMLTEPLINMTRLNRSEREERVWKVIDLVGLKPEYLSRLPHTFSSGERQRIAIARALVMEPVCIIADEPLSSLESSAQSQIINLMLDLQKNLNLSFILVTHDANVIRHMCDKVMVLCRGRIVEYGNTSDVINSPQHPYTQQFLDVSIHFPRIQTSAEMDANISACVFHERCNIAQQQCKEVMPKLSKKGSHLVSCHLIDGS